MCKSASPLAAVFSTALVSVALAGCSGSNQVGDGDDYIAAITPNNCVLDAEIEFSEQNNIGENEQITNQTLFNEYKGLTLAYANAADEAVAALAAKSWPENIKNDVADAMADYTITGALARAGVISDGQNEDDGADWDTINGFKNFYLENSKAPDTRKIRAELGLPEVGGYDCEGVELTADLVTPSGTGDGASFESGQAGLTAIGALDEEQFFDDLINSKVTYEELSDEDWSKLIANVSLFSDQELALARELESKEWPAPVKSHILDYIAYLYVSSAFSRAQVLTDTVPGDRADFRELDSFSSEWVLKGQRVNFDAIRSGLGLEVQKFN
ncbi:MAG: hypothetical protein FJW50_02475 [Actinobacteria bacterium]|nr:hypothetical protein [Actinomycetota bacterium]